MRPLLKVVARQLVNCMRRHAICWLKVEAFNEKTRTEDSVRKTRDTDVVLDQPVGSRGSPPRQVRRVDPGPASPQREQPRQAQHGGGKAQVSVKILAEDTDIEKHYRQVAHLGQGMFGNTYEVVDVNSPQIRLAMKVQTKKSKWFVHLNEPERELLRIYKEFLILNRILPRHKHIVEVKDLLISPNNVYIVLELCTSLTLENFYRVADNASGRRIFGQIADAIHFMHEYGVLHLDIKGDNILFADNDFQNCKVIDFGVSQFRPEWAKKVHQNFKASDWFDEQELAPQNDLTQLDDVRNLGYVLLCIMCGKHVQSTNTVANMLAKSKPRLDIFDEKAMNLLEMIGPRPFGPEKDADHPTMDQVINHPWLKGGNVSLQHKSLNAEFELLKRDFTTLKVLLKDWAIMPPKVIRNDVEISNFYLTTGTVHKGPYDSRLPECTGVTDPYLEPRLMKLLYRGGDPAVVTSPTEAAQESLRVFSELLITLRILPKHDNIVEIFDVLVSEDYAVVIRDLWGTHTLEEFFRQASGENSRVVFKQLAETVRFMHQYGVVHMDLRTDNVVFEDSTFSKCKIVDFTHALYLPQMAQSINDHFQLDKWSNRELHLMALSADPEIDIRALGRILHSMMAGSWQHDLSKLSAPRADAFDPAASDLLLKIGPPPFGPAEGQRISTMDEVCSHPWLLLSEPEEEYEEPYQEEFDPYDTPWQIPDPF
ncbi:hypothetical protein Mapa_000011 [Marchantia paleacea]|nr:hypothetical protein Mapa_000011 [Marchantia paleacea]